MCGLPNHPCHNELKMVKNAYTDEIKKAKQQHWLNWLENIEGNNLWTANRYISSEPRDGGKTRIPMLMMKKADGTIDEAATNNEKSIMIAKSFFSPPPALNTVPPNSPNSHTRPYLPQSNHPCDISTEQFQDTWT